MMLGFGVGVILHQVTDTPRSEVGAKRVQCGQAHVINLRALHPLDGCRRKSCLLRNLGKGQITILPCFFVASKLVKVALKHFRLSIHQTAYLQINMVIFYHEALDKVNSLSHNIVVNLQSMNPNHGVKLQDILLGFRAVLLAGNGALVGLRITPQCPAGQRGESASSPLLQGTLS